MYETEQNSIPLFVALLYYSTFSHVQDRALEKRAFFILEPEWNLPRYSVIYIHIYSLRNERRYIDSARVTRKCEFSILSSSIAFQHRYVDLDLQQCFTEDRERFFSLYSRITDKFRIYKHFQQCICSFWVQYKVFLYMFGKLRTLTA